MAVEFVSAKAAAAVPGGGASESSSGDAESPGSLPIKRGYTFGEPSSGGGMPITIQVCLWLAARLRNPPPRLCRGALCMCLCSVDSACLG